MKPDDELTALVAQIHQHDFAAQLRARTLSSTALETLAALRSHSDQIVRLLTYRCLEQIADPAVGACCYAGLFDSDPVVAGAAMQTLEHHAEASTTPELVAAYRRMPAPHIRARLALLLGRRADPEAYRALLRLRGDSDPEAHVGLLWALARGGDAAARHEFAVELQRALTGQLERWFEGCLYIAQPWLFHVLRPTLLNLSPVRWIGPHVPVFGHAQTLRACDIAINIIGEIARRQGLQLPSGVSFREDKNYLDAEIGTVALWIDTLAAESL